MRRADFAYRWAVVVGLLAGSAVPALPDTGPPVEVFLSRDAQPAKAGQPYEARFEIVAYEGGVLSGFRLSGKHWSAPSLAAPAMMSLAKDEVRALSFTGVPADPREPLVLELEFNGQTKRWSFDLSERYFAMIEPTCPAVETSARLPVRGTSRISELPGDDRLNEERLGTVPEPGPGAITVNVHGWFGFIKDDTVGVGAPNVAIAVQDWRMTWDEPITLIGTGYTDDWGYYNIPCTFTPTPSDPHPDIIVAFNSYSFNGKVSMKPPLPFADPFQFVSDLMPDVMGNDADFGNLVPGIEGYFGGLHVYTCAYRTWLYSYGYQHVDVTPVNVIWPDASWPHYNHPSRTMFIADSFSWIEGTISHEYGHHWLYENAWAESPEYCNGFCDDPTCGHCNWCWEGGAIAWTEGFPNFLGHIVPMSYATEYGDSARHPFDYEFIGTCSQDGTYHNPDYTEGFAAAVLQDICDANVWPDSHQVFGPWADALSLGADEIFWVADNLYPTSPGHFLQLFLAEYPEYKNGLWETAINCGYQLDQYPPGAVTGLTSPSHPVDVPTPNPYVVLNWTAADDDASGAGEYSIMAAPTPGLPDAGPETGAVESDTIVLGPGTYYISVRARDRAGNWSMDYESYGPVIVSAITSANLEFELRTGWDYEVVARPNSYATPNWCPAPSNLNGDVPYTWSNAAYTNSGTQAANNFDNALFRDGALVDIWSNISLPGMTSGYLINWNQMPVRGGRHTIEVALDYNNEIYESNETDNRMARQWVWTPTSLTAGVPAVRMAPPGRTRGWDSIPSHLTKWYNCDGLRFNSSGNWNAVAVRPLVNTANYHCRLFPASTRPDNGFDTPFAISAAPAGYLDLLVVNGRNMGHIDWDVGVVNDDPPSSDDYEIVHVTSGVLSLGDSVTVNFASEEMIRLWEFYVGGGGPWPLLITITTDPSEPVQAWYFDETYTCGDPAPGHYAWTTTYNSGRGQMVVPSADPGWHGLVVYRNPKDGTGPIPVTIEIQLAPPDFDHYIPAGWYRSLTPRPAPDGTPGYAPMPDTLHGNTSSTYFNISCENDGLADAPFLDADIELDGLPAWWFAWGTFPSGGVSIFNWTAPQMVRGGRHTLAFRLDPDHEIEEVHENDNIWGEQYCWSPIEMAVGSVITRPAPPERMGGWSNITSGETSWFNCDGMRLPPAGGGWWKALAVMPGLSSNVDIRLHDMRAGVKAGFTGTIVYSGWPTGQSDYVLVNQNWTPDSYDAGVVKISGTENYTAHSDGARYHSWDGDETYGPFVMEAGQIVHLHEFLLPVGTVHLSLLNVSGSVDWGMTLHTWDEWFLSKSDAPDSCHSWLAGPGMGESLRADIEDFAYYCVAIWKRDATSLPLEGTYELYVTNTPTGVEDTAPPARTALAGAYPNPFNPRTRIEFDLATEQPVRLEIFDIRGARVRTLVNAVLPAARHTAVWDGRDDAGGSAASGIYFARLVAGDFRDVRKLVLLK